MATALTLAAASCGGDTLYDEVGPGEGGAPVVEIVSPGTGAQVVAGQRLPIQVEATDPEGVSRITIEVTGVVTETITLQFTPPRVAVVADTAVTIPPRTSGSIQIAARARDTQGREADADGISLQVSDIDAFGPAVSLQVESMDRMELTDEIRMTVRAVDNPGGSGVVRTQVTAIVANTARSDTLVLTPSSTLSSPRSDTVTSVFTFRPPHVDSLSLPDTLFILFSGLAYDDEGNCGGAVGPGFTTSVPCDTVTVAGSETVIASAVNSPERIVAVSGRTSIPTGEGVLADLLVDTLRSQVYVSNLGRNRLQILEEPDHTWGPEVFVGAEPWGLALNADGDSLFVANSGGTSISFVGLTAASPTEDIGRRYVTNNNALFTVTIEEGKLTGTFQDYSDRPQFVAQDAAGKLLFSTRPTGTAQPGTVRRVETRSGWPSPETRILVFDDDLVNATNSTAIAHVDSIFFSVDRTRIIIYDHPPGFPGVTVNSGLQPLEAALDSMGTLAAANQSDIFYREGAEWNFTRLNMEDTTFVAASGDRNWIAFGEGGTDSGTAGRITYWHAPAEEIHQSLLVADLVNNASERVTGLDLNDDGSIAAGNGSFGSYYFDEDLRLRGSVSSFAPAGHGAALHPDHPDYVQGLPSSERTLSFVGQGDFTIRILDTVHFTERGSLHIRDNITGPLRAAPPLPSDNAGQGRNCSGQNCIVLKLYGLTDAGGVVVVNVRRRDIESLQ